MLEILEMTIGDYDEVMSLWRQTPELGVSPDFDTRDRIEVYLERNPGTSTIAREGNRTIGTVLCGHDGRRGSIYHVTVVEEYRGRGIAKKMLERSMACLKQVGIETGFLFVHANNSNAARFWSKEGWHPAPNITYYSRQF